ncbi:MAG TPA: DUF4082 domain-containing protein, partial [Candidatus Saccharimonadales bacterium]|nr:DUF4082 domain-containing protein [Candidatus Saccharimonadales bacterium]
MSSDGVGIELGFKFKADQDGYISGIRFYKVAGMTGAHTASLWDTFGNRIAQAISTNESPAGWQEVNFSPVAVTANTIYTASVFMADGNYVATPNFFTSDITNSPLLAPQHGTTAARDAGGNSGQGVYNPSGSSLYPMNSFNMANYWIDVSYVTSLETGSLIVSAKTPAADSSEVSLTDAITATFDRPLDETTVAGASFTVKDGQGSTVPGAVSYDATTYMAKFVPNTIWQTDTTYTVTLNGEGTDPAVADMQGYKLAVDYVWSFTTTAVALECPCAIRNGQNPAGSDTYRDTSVNGLELGMKVIPTANGYLTALRFYKPIINPETTHIGHVWGANGVSLATVTFTNESAYGWQEAILSSPLPVVKDKVYIISYGMPTPYYQAKFNSFTQPMSSLGFTAYPAGDTRNTATGSGTGNPVYATTAGAYPSSSSLNNVDYYLDAVFSLSSTNPIPRPQIVNTQPSDESYAVLRTTSGSATFDQPLDGSTVNSTTVQAFDESGSSVAGTVSYDSSKRMVTFTPTGSFSYDATYTLRLSSQIANTQGVSLGADYSWSFTTGSPLAADMNQGNGGPILVVTTDANPSSSYYAEILRTEGFTYFDVKDVSLLSAAALSGYATVILSETTLTQPQVDMLSSWVNGGGSLIAMRPDKKLAGLLGLTDAGSLSTNQYMRTNTASPVGMGIVDDTIQFKGAADNYTLSGASVAATLYSDATTATSYPAATTREVGLGTAGAFTYDLAQSIIGLHQGNIAWSRQDRNGDGYIRTNDLFFGPRAGDVQPDWLDSNKMAIPQADEQQRLLANMITEAMREHLPAPRFWYLPDDQKVALVLAGDDHDRTNDSGTEQIINDWLNESPSGCSVADWQCVRASHYVFVGGA